MEWIEERKYFVLQAFLLSIDKKYNYFFLRFNNARRLDLQDILDFYDLVISTVNHLIYIQVKNVERSLEYF